MSLHHPKPRFGYDPTTGRIFDYVLNRDVDVVEAYEAADGTWNLVLVRDAIMAHEPIESAHLKIISKADQVKAADAKEKAAADAKAKACAKAIEDGKKADAEAKARAEADAKAAADQAAKEKAAAEAGADEPPPPPGS